MVRMRTKRRRSTGTWRRWRGRRSGVAGAVTAVLFVIIITTILTAVALYYVPVWSKDAEAAHMSRVANQFFALRDGVEDQLAQGETAGSLYFHIALSSGTTTSFLGIQGEPSSGTLSFDANASLFEVCDTDSPDELFALSRGSLIFRSRNMYHPQQEYVYEGGAVLVHQEGHSTVREGPAPEFKRDRWGSLTLTIPLYALFGEGVSVTGAGSAGVETRVLHYEETLIPFPGERNVTLNATTRHADGWLRWLNASIQEQAAAANLTGSEVSLSQTPEGFRMDARGIVSLTIRFAVVEVKVSR
ncbi:MAG: hypothetical protein QXD84_07415 [Thermoplasmata archaeon]